MESEVSSDFDFVLKKYLEKIKDSDSKLDAILMGTRIDDPHGKYVSDFSPTDVDKGERYCLTRIFFIKMR